MLSVVILNVSFFYCYAECYYAKCFIFIVMLSNVILSVFGVFRTFSSLKCTFFQYERCHDTQQNDTRLIDTHHSVSEYDSTQHRNINW